FTATFDDREGFVIQGVGDSPEEAVGKIRAELERLGENAEGLMREHGVEVRQETLHAKGGKVVQGLKDSDLEWRLRDRYSQIQERLLGKHDWTRGKLSDPDPSLTAEDIARLRAERDRLVNLIN